MRNVWSHLTFLHWAVAPEQLRPLVPPELEIDTFDGQAYVGLVPFTMTGVRPSWLPPLPLAAQLWENFHETNVRTYVHHRGREPGVWFFSLDASSAIAVGAARAWYKLPYFFSHMHLEAQTRGDSHTIEYSSKRKWPRPTNAGSAIRCSVDSPVALAQPGTLEHFLAERYVLYSKTGDKLFRGRVHHAPYPLQRGAVTQMNETLLRAAGITRPDTPPLVHYAREVSVEIFPLERVRT